MLHFENGLDMRLLTPVNHQTLCSIRDIRKMGHTQVTIVYGPKRDKHVMAHVDPPPPTLEDRTEALRKNYADCGIPGYWDNKYIDHPMAPEWSSNFKLTD